MHPVMRKVPPALALTPIVALFAAACATVPPSQAAAADEPTSRAERVAQTLSAAASADAAHDAVGLGRAIRMLDASGARPLDESAPDPIPLWRERAKDDLPPLRGRPLGPGYRSGTIIGGGRDSFAQLFLSGTASTIALSAPTGDRLALRVFDKDDKPVCERAASQPGACRWVPLFTQRYTIEVKNLGPADARYFLVIE